MSIQCCIIRQHKTKLQFSDNLKHKYYGDTTGTLIVTHC